MEFAAAVSRLAKLNPLVGCRPKMDAIEKLPGTLRLQTSTTPVTATQKKDNNLAPGVKI